MKVISKRIVLLTILSVTFYYGQAQNVFFTDAPENSMVSPTQKRLIIPVKYRTVKLSPAAIKSFLDGVPAEQNLISRNAAPVLDIPMPDGSSAAFNIWHTAVMAPELAAANPGIKTFTGQGINDPTATIQLEWTEAGFHAMILSPLSGTVFIDPYHQKTVTNYISYYKADYKKSVQFLELPIVKNVQQVNSVANTLAGVCVGTQLRTYRLAVACTHQYAQTVTGAATPTVAETLAKIVTTINRVNGVYEKELSIRLQLVAAENAVIFTVAASDPFTGNSNGNTLISESQTVIDARIGAANYDIGHTFSTGGGGVAEPGVVCVNGVKARGVTGSASPSSDAYDIDFVAHEIGHQFNANHTFNSVTLNCAPPNWNSVANAEPGSGSTIMAYAGICGANDLQLNSDAQFHGVSFNEITAYSNSGAGNSCPVITNINNSPPVINAGQDYIIPKTTPFILSGGGTDANGDAITFSWEQVNVGGPNGTWDNPSGNAPLFRSFTPQSTPVRFFPKITDVINNTTTIGELLPTYARSLNFRLTGRDNRAGGGGVCFDEAAITVSGTAGPFVVTSPNLNGITWQVNDFTTITWNPSGTASAPINCSNVKIELSTDGGLSYAVTLAENTPNDGAHEINVPNNITLAARIRISAVGNIFYDISNSNFSIQNQGLAEFVFNSPGPVVLCGESSGVINLNTAALNGFSTPVSLSAIGLPPGTSVTFGSNPLLPGSNTTVTLNNTNTLAAGTYNITINGLAGAVNKARVISFVISGVPVAPSSLLIPAGNATGVATLPSFNWQPVALASYYTLEISTSGTFSNIIQSITDISVLPVVPLTPLAQNTVFYWRVLSTTVCGTSAPSATGIFKTGLIVCNTRNSADIPKVISEIGINTITSTLIIPASAGLTISDLNVVGLTGTHTYVGDLTVSLTSPAGTTVVLFDEVCDDAQNFLVNLDDEAALVTLPCPFASNQTARPAGSLSAFDGQNSAGVWTLTVRDNVDADGGSLNGWGLAINCAFTATAILPPHTQLCPPASGTSLTAGITGAAYQWQVNTGSGFVNIANNTNYNGVNNVTLQISNAPSSFNGYQYRCLVDGSISQVFTLGFTSNWTGLISNAWETAANWSCNTIPDANTDVIIYNGTVIVSSNAMCRSIKTNPGTNVMVNGGGTITVTH